MNVICREFAALLLLLIIPVSVSDCIDHYNLAKHYSPVIVQFLLGENMWGDYITRIDFDGNYQGDDNWDNLEAVHCNQQLYAHVYYSVVETETHYFICYALYHPSDDLHRVWSKRVFGYFANEHENDLEGIIMCIQKDNGQYGPYGRLRIVQLQAHYDFYQFRAPGATDISKGTKENYDNIDGTIEIIENESGYHPVVYVEAGGHGIRKGMAEILEFYEKQAKDFEEMYEAMYGIPIDLPELTLDMHVRYVYTGNAQDPDAVGDSLAASRSVGYDLLSIFAEMWENNDNCCGHGYLYGKDGTYDRFGMYDGKLGRRFDGNDGGDDKASPPWKWNDKWDEVPAGDWFMNPAWYHEERLSFPEEISQDYVFHPFGFYHLGDAIYNGKNGITELRIGPYLIVRDVVILQGQTVIVHAGRVSDFKPNTGIIANGKLEVKENARFQHFSNNSVGVQLHTGGKIVVERGGCIRFY